MIKVKVVMVELDRRSGHWRIGQEVDEGGGAITRHLHLVPPRAFVEHAAEYQLDPADSRTVLDWLLHERFVRRSDPRVPGPTCPYRNPPRQAWAVHQDNLSEVKSRVAVTDPDGLLEQIHREHNPHPVHVVQALDRVRATRAHVAHTDRSRSNG